MLATLRSASVLAERACGNEPVKLVALSDWGSAIEVRREHDRDSIGFRKEALYQFD